MSTVLITLREGPYGSEMPFTALKLAGTILAEHPQTAVRLFLVSDAVHCAVDQQTPPEGWPNIGEMLRDVIARGVFTSTADLKRKLMRYIRHYNKAPRTVKWKYFDPTRRIPAH